MHVMLQSSTCFHVVLQQQFTAKNSNGHTFQGCVAKVEESLKQPVHLEMRKRTSINVSELHNTDTTVIPRIPRQYLFSTPMVQSSRTTTMFAKMTIKNFPNPATFSPFVQHFTQTSVNSKDICMHMS